VFGSDRAAEKDGVSGGMLCATTIRITSGAGLFVREGESCCGCRGLFCLTDFIRLEFQGTEAVVIEPRRLVRENEREKIGTLLGHVLRT